MITYEYKKSSAQDLHRLTKRPSINMEETLKLVKPVAANVKQNGLASALDYAEKFDCFRPASVKVTGEEFDDAENILDDDIKSAIENAAENISAFHAKQLPESYSVTTAVGVECSREFRPISNVGLYIPGGSAVLPSTMLMLGIPAKIAGCHRVAACSPTKDGTINPAILYAAKVCDINEFYKLGGAQAVALLAYGDDEIPKVDKFFGPGNQFVTAAKMIVSTDPDGCAIDMPAGPSEVLVIADRSADASFVAADMLSQAEHGIDSQAILVTTDKNKAAEVEKEIAKQLSSLNRKEILTQSLENSFALITDNLNDAFAFSNSYAPEHLILNIANADKYKDKIINAGSVFLGSYSPESAGDYASGTNHSLPTYGYAKAYSGLCVEMFMKGITFQNLSRAGLEGISKTVITLAETEKLQAHANAIKIRLEK